MEPCWNIKSFNMVLLSTYWRVLRYQLAFLRWNRCCSLCQASGSSSFFFFFFTFYKYFHNPFESIHYPSIFIIRFFQVRPKKVRPGCTLVEPTLTVVQGFIQERCYQQAALLGLLNPNDRKAQGSSETFRKEPTSLQYWQYLVIPKKCQR